MPELPPKKVGIVACSGEELAEGTVTRLAALRVLEQLRPQETVTICLPLFLAGGEGDRAFARFYPTIAVDGCDLRCAARATEMYSGKPAAGIVVSEVVNRAGLDQPGGRRRLNEAGRLAVDVVADEIAGIVDDLLGKRWSRRRGEFIEMVKNPDYFVKGRPYLDSIRYVIIVERGTRTAALQSGQLDAAMPGETTKTAAEQLKKAVPQLVVTPVATSVTDNIIMNSKKPPFDNPKVRLAVAYAIDRKAMIRAVHQGGAVPGATMPPPPYGVWGILEKDLAALPGYGKAADMKAQARKLLAEAGFSPQQPLRVEMATRAIALYVDMASFVINELKQVGIDLSPRTRGRIPAINRALYGLPKPECGSRETRRMPFEAARRQGVAAALLREAAAHARALGAASLSLSTALDNAPAQALYESQGWERDRQFCEYTLRL